MTAKFREFVCLIVVFCVSNAILSRAQTFTTLGSFDGTNGEQPFSGMIQGIYGIYGTASTGGANGEGVVFALTANKFVTIYNFCSQSACSDGELPNGGLSLDSSGNLYGTTSSGGTDIGTVFELSPANAFTSLYDFNSTIDYPYGTLLLSDGNFYGVGASGIAAPSAIYQITSTDALNLLYTFCSLPNCADGNSANGGLVQGTNGNLYGTTVNYGANGKGGTVFQITPTGTLTTLYSFCAKANCADGENPSPLILATDGNFYGATQAGGKYGQGSVFYITPTGALTTVYSFCAKTGCPDGSGPTGIMQATNGTFYGVTTSGGTYSSGTIFKIPASGKLSTVHDFCEQADCADGSDPIGVPMQGTNGLIYGTTFTGGPNNLGTVYSLSQGIHPFVTSLSNSGSAGQGIVIIGNDLKNTRSVSFNGTPASFTEVAPTDINATVPVGATSGYITLVTPNGTFQSSQPFTVISATGSGAEER
jgi:uncharacterized repeat protein (TIGR03803 family)